ncbi:hypothetical protein [Streptomyces sp. NBC_01789]|uniref:hypothetical protein n=1 Tax=Streptomyces sp. NBC_01789 TaxID=2975941 RepID=UPI00225B7562|nr:hypothetical protein [Streptomyces sp. NBC_01789]MCX4450687.1 hypothetical protein [Streptomyces sp. NBC_01789]
MAHTLIPVGTHVFVTPGTVTWNDGTQTTDRPYQAMVAGYDIHRSKYRLDRLIYEGLYATGGHSWAFLDEVAEFDAVDTPKEP